MTTAGLAGPAMTAEFTYLIDIKFVTRPALTSSAGAGASA